MKRILPLLFLLSALSLSASAQRSVLRGIIVDDADDAPIAGVVVLVDSTLHAVTDVWGAFSIPDIPRQEAVVEISFLGYKPIRLTQNFDRGTINLGTVRMQEDQVQLEGVTVTALSKAVVQRGDTTQFSAAAFKTNPDADASDLVAKLPGMEVTESGVTARGEDIARTYVNGELFFGDNAMAALSNLPADLVESIEMFDEQPDEARFSGFNDGQTQRVLNIVTRGGKINRTIDARLEVAYGQELQRDMDGKYQPRYDVGGRLNYITSNQSVNLNGSLNNTNRRGFGGRGSGGGFGGGGSGLRTMESFGANYMNKINEKSEFNIGYEYSGNKNRQNSLTINDYYATDDFNSRVTRDTLSLRSSGYEHNIESRYEYEHARDRLLVEIEAGTDGSKRESFGIYQEWRNDSDFSLSQDNDYSKSNGYNIEASARWMHRLGEKAGRTFSVQGSFDLGEDTSDGEEDSDLTKFHEGDTDPTNIYWDSDGMQSRRLYSLGLTYNEPLGERALLNFNYRPAYNYSSDELIRVDRFGELDSLVSERFTYDYITHTGRVGLSFNKADVFNFSVSVSGQSASRAQTMTLPRDYEMDRSFTSVLPTFYFQYFLKQTKYFRINYGTFSQLPSLEQLSTMVDVTNPMRYKAGNPDLKQNYNHSLGFQYYTTNNQRSTSFDFGFNGSITSNSIQLRTIYFTDDTVLPEYGDFVFEPGTTLETSVNAGTASSLRANVGYSFVFRPLKLNMYARANYGYRHTPTYVGSTLNKVNNNEAGFFVGFNSNISENLDFRVNGSIRYSNTDNPSSPNKNTWSQNAFAMVNYIFGSGFVFNTNYMFSTSSTLREPSNVWSASIGHKFLKNNSAEFRIEFNDILNQSRNYNYIYGAQAETRSWNRVMGRYVMARLSYRFNSLRNNRAQGQDGQEGDPFRQGGDRFPGGGEFRRDGGGFPEGGRPMMGPPRGGFGG